MLCYLSIVLKFSADDAGGAVAVKPKEKCFLRVVIGMLVLLTLTLSIAFAFRTHIEVTPATTCSEVVGVKNYQTMFFGVVPGSINTYYILANGREIHIHSYEAIWGEQHDPTNGTRKICITVYQPKR